MRIFFNAVTFYFISVWLLASSVQAAPVLFNDPQFEIVKEFDIVYAKGATKNGEIDLKLDLYRPMGKKAPALKPGLLIMHGGWFMVGDKLADIGDMATLARNMAARGYVTISINYRLGPDKARVIEKEMSQASVEVNKVLAEYARAGKSIDSIYAGMTAAELTAMRAAAVVDEGRALAWLVANAERYGIDPTRIAVGGSSAGAISTLNLIYDSGNEVAKYARAIVPMWGKLDDEGLPKITAKSAPFLVIHGTKDDVVAFSGAEALVARAKEVGLAHRLFALDGAGHSPPLALEMDGQNFYEHIADFLYQHMDLENLN